MNMSSSVGIDFELLYPVLRFPGRAIQKAIAFDAYESRIFFWIGERYLSTTNIWNFVHYTLWSLTSEHRTESLFSLATIRIGRKSNDWLKIILNSTPQPYVLSKRILIYIWILLKISPIKKFKFDLLFSVHLILLQKSMKYYFSFQCFYFEPKSN